RACADHVLAEGTTVGAVRNAGGRGTPGRVHDQRSGWTMEQCSSRVGSQMICASRAGRGVRGATEGRRARPSVSLPLEAGPWQANGLIVCRRRSADISHSNSNQLVCLLPPCQSGGEGKQE
ncbi:hypothetical protein BgiBS90_006392, partial [Biomphalaria glabrata]